MRESPRVLKYGYSDFIMKRYALISIILSVIVLLLCSRNRNPFSPEGNYYSTEFLFEFPTRPRSNIIVIDDEYGCVYIANFRLGNSNRKVMKYNLNGELLSMVVNFTTNQHGKYSRYIPIDLTIGANHCLYILVKPYFKLEDDDNWSSYDGFCIMVYDSQGNFQKEVDFAEYSMEWSPVAIAYGDDSLYVTNHQFLIKVDIFTCQSTEMPLPMRTEGNYVMPELIVTDMEVDVNNNIWFAGLSLFINTSAGCRVMKMSPDGKNHFIFNSKGLVSNIGAAPNNPGIALDKNGNVYMATFYGRALEIFSPSGLSLSNVKVNIEGKDRILPIDVAIDSVHNIYVLDHWNELVRVFKAPQWLRPMRR